MTPRWRLLGKRQSATTDRAKPPQKRGKLSLPLTALAGILAGGLLGWFVIDPYSWGWIERTNWLAGIVAVGLGYLALRPRPPAQSVPDHIAAASPPEGGEGTDDDVRSDNVSASVTALWTGVERLIVEDNARRVAAGKRPRTKKEIAIAVGTSDRTFYRWLNQKSHMPDKAKFLNVIQELGGDSSSWEARWRRAQIAPDSSVPRRQEQLEIANTRESEQTHKVRQHMVSTIRNRWLVLGLAVFIGLTAGGVMAWEAYRPDETWEGEVFNTDRGGRDVGVNSYVGPYNTVKDRGKVHSFFKGYLVAVECQVKDGRPITDPAARTTSRRWYRLDDSSYLPALYVRVPPGIPTC